MGSRFIMLNNSSHPFIKGNDKSLSYSATDKRGYKAVFAGKVELGGVFRRKSVGICNVVITGNLA